MKTNKIVLFKVLIIRKFSVDKNNCENLFNIFLEEKISQISENFTLEKI